jgi:hypothetical protein
VDLKYSIEPWRREQTADKPGVKFTQLLEISKPALQAISQPLTPVTGPTVYFPSTTAGEILSFAPPWTGATGLTRKEFECDWNKRRMTSSVDDTPADARSVDSERSWSLKPLLRHAQRSHSKMPGIRKIPLRAIGIILLIALLNCIVWIAAAIVLVGLNPPFSSQFWISANIS